MVEGPMEYAVQDVAGMLGVRIEGKEPVGPLRLVSMIEQGLPVAALDRVSAAVSPHDPGFRHLVVPRATLTRRRKHHDPRLSAEESGRLARIAGVWAFALNVWGHDEEEARAFLFRPHPLLEMRRPIDLALGSELGAQM